MVFTSPILKERIWGGTAILKNYGYPSQDSTPIGEVWGISGHRSGDCPIPSRPGETLASLAAQDASLLGQCYPSFPLQIRLLDSKDKLSVQVHPDDAYAAEHSGDGGKNEYWYILAAPPGASIVYGHNCSSSEELSKKITEEDLEGVLNYLPVQRGDMIFVPTGLIHALGAGITAVEISDSSNTTYRVYDYMRRDSNGNLRELHLTHALKVINFPCVYPVLGAMRDFYFGLSRTVLADDPLFYIAHWVSKGTAEVPRDHPYYAAFVCEGEGFLNGVPLTAGDFFIIPPAETHLNFKGNFSLITAYAKKGKHQ